MLKLLRESVFPLTRKNEEVNDDVPFMMKTAALIVSTGLAESRPPCGECAVSVRSFCVTLIVGLSLA